MFIEISFPVIAVSRSTVAQRVGTRQRHFDRTNLFQDSSKLEKTHLSKEEFFLSERIGNQARNGVRQWTDGVDADKV